MFADRLMTVCCNFKSAYYTFILTPFNILCKYDKSYLFSFPDTFIVIEILYNHYNSQKSKAIKNGIQRVYKV